MEGLAFHHFGLAVRKPDDGVAFLSMLGYRMENPILDKIQNVHLMMGWHDSQPAVEVIYEGTDAGPIDKLIQRHPQGIIYHVCYVTTNLQESLDQLETAGLRVLCISSPKPALLFQDRMVSFYNIVGMGLIEILQ